MDSGTSIGLEKSIQAIKISREKRRRYEDVEKENISSVIKRILAGETTGDKIHDFSIVVHEDIDMKFVKPYRDLEQMLKGRIREPIFVVRINEATEYQQSRIDALMYLGILDSDRLDFDFGRLLENKNWCFEFYSKEPHGELLDINNIAPSVILPVSSYVQKRTRFIGELGTTSGGKWEVGKERVKINKMEMSEGLIDRYYFLDSMEGLPIPGKRNTRGRHGYFKAALIRVGDKEIRDFFGEQVVHELREYENGIKLLNSKK